jgi:beta-alanine--pyruvate transaminase
MLPEPASAGASDAPILDTWWMPFTANRSFKASPRLLVCAQDMHYVDADGRAVLDGTAGLWCVNAGHTRAPIVQAIQTAAATLDYAPGFQMAHPAGYALADALVALMPPGLDRVFFTNSGSEAVDTALKIALAFWRARGQPERALFVGRARGYHGVGFGGISVGGIAPNRAAFASQLLPHVRHLPDTYDHATQAFSRGQPTVGAEQADALETIIAEEGAHRIAAVIVEPVAGSTGVLVPPAGYLERLRAICSAHDILLIFDEVITGFGRTGAPFAAQTFGVTPDILTLAKGLTNGSVPMGAAVVRRAIHDAVLEASESGIEFFHGYTYSGHPLACAAGLATLRVYEDEGLLTRAAALAGAWADAVHALADAPHVIDVRSIGMVAGIELASREGAPGARGSEVLARCFHEEQVLVRTTRDIIALSPPLIVSEAQIGQLVDAVRRVLQRLA